MRTLLDEAFAPITSTIGFLELPLSQAAEGMEAWQRTNHVTVEISNPNESFPEVLRLLEPLNGGSRLRRLLVKAGEWTAYFDNGLRGTDAASPIGHLSLTQKCRGLAVRAVPHSPGPKGRMGSVQFELFGPKPTAWLNYVRTITASYDGKWVFHTFGEPLPFEEIDCYRARRKRDRFTSEMLEHYCQALGVDVFNPDFYGPEAILFHTPEKLPPEAHVKTLKEVQEWLGIDPGKAATLPG